MPKFFQTNNRNPQRAIYYLITYSICYLSLGLGNASLGRMLPILAENIQVSYGQISFLFSAHSLGYLTGSAGGGHLYDRFKGHSLMMFALGLMMIMGVLIPLIPVFYLLLIGIFFFGLGQGSLDIGGNVNLMWVYQSRVGPFMNALHFSFGLGAFLSPIVISYVILRTGEVLRWPYWVLAVLFFPGVLGLALLKSPKNPEKENKNLNHSFVNTRLIVLMIALFFIYVGIETGFSGWILTYAIVTNIATETVATYIISIFWGALTIGRLLSIPLAKIFSPSKLLLGNFVLSISFLGAILLRPTSVLMIWVCSAGLGLSLSSVFPTLLALIETRIKITGAVTGLFFLGSSLGGALFPMVLGQIFEHIGPYQIMIALFLYTCLGLSILVSVILATNRVGEKVRT